MWWDLDKEAGSSSLRSLGEGGWNLTAGSLGVMQCCCRDYICSISSRSQVLRVHLWGRREFTVLGCKCGGYESKEEGAWISSQICHKIKVQKHDKPDWRKSREPEFMRSFWRGVRDVNAAWRYDKVSVLRLGSEDQSQSAWLSPAR